MGQNTAIEWAHHTFNAWTGCAKVSPGCEHCYAAEIAHRFQGTIGQWGPGGTRLLASDATWRQPLKWDRWAAEGVCYQCGGKRTVRVSRKDTTMIKCPACDGAGQMQPYRARVFCQSMSDVFEDWNGPLLSSSGEPVVHRNGSQWTMSEIRLQLFALICSTPHLDWLLLTKRPENIRSMWSYRFRRGDLTSFGAEILHEDPRRLDNVWLGTSVENQEQADKRIPLLEECRDLAPVLFLSGEPLLGGVDLDFACVRRELSCIDWVICGGESGDHARPMHPDWARSLRDQCQAADVPFFFKQWGEWCPSSVAPEPVAVPTTILAGTSAECVVDKKPDQQFQVLKREGGNRIIRADGKFSGEGPEAGDAWMIRVGKKLAGRELDGRVWNQFPTVTD